MISFVFIPNIQLKLPSRFVLIVTIFTRNPPCSKPASLEYLSFDYCNKKVMIAIDISPRNDSYIRIAYCNILDYSRSTFFVSDDGSNH